MESVETKFKTDKELERHLEVFFRMTLNETHNKINTLLKNQLQYKLISFEIPNEKTYEEYQTTIDDKKCFKICFEEIFNQKVDRQDYSAMLLKYCQKAFNGKNPGYDSKRISDSQYDVMVKIGEENVIKYSICCVSKKTVKKAAAFETIERLFPGLHKWLLIGNSKKEKSLEETSQDIIEELSIVTKEGDDFYQEIYDVLEGEVIKFDISAYQLKKKFLKVRFSKSIPQG